MRGKTTRRNQTLALSLALSPPKPLLASPCLVLFGGSLLDGGPSYDSGHLFTLEWTPPNLEGPEIDSPRGVTGPAHVHMVRPLDPVNSAGFGFLSRAVHRWIDTKCRWCGLCVPRAVRWRTRRRCRRSWRVGPTPPRASSAAPPPPAPHSGCVHFTHCSIVYSRHALIKGLTWPSEPRRLTGPSLVVRVVVWGSCRCASPCPGSTRRSRP